MTRYACAITLLLATVLTEPLVAATELSAHYNRVLKLSEDYNSWQDVIEHLQKEVALDPRDWEHAAMLAFAYFETREFAKALEQFDLLLDAASKDGKSLPDLALYKAWALFELGRPEESQQWLEAHADLWSSDSELWEEYEFLRDQVDTILAEEPVAPNQWALLPPKSAEAILDQCSRPTPPLEGTWLPSVQQIAELEQRLPAVRRQRSDLCCLSGGRVININAYHRQYVGVIVEGQHLIYINAFVLDDDSGVWRKQPIVICDGGSDYWGALYDPETGEFADLAFNGIA